MNECQLITTSLLASNDVDRPMLLCATGTHTSLCDRFFTVAGPHLWNNLPLYLLDSELSLLEFCLLLKTYLCFWCWQYLVTLLSECSYLFAYLVSSCTSAWCHSCCLCSSAADVLLSELDTASVNLSYQVVSHCWTFLTNTLLLSVKLQGFQVSQNSGGSPRNAIVSPTSPKHVGISENMADCCRSSWLHLHCLAMLIVNQVSRKNTHRTI